MLHYMPFCTSCGAEVAADTKFCEQCGAPTEPVAAPGGPAAPAALHVPVHPQHPYWMTTPPAEPKKPKTALIIGGIVIVLAIVAAAYFVGMHLLKANQKSSSGLTPSNSLPVTYTMEQTALPTPQYTPVIPETTTLPLVVRDERLEENYKPVYSLDQKFAYGQKVDFAHELTNPPLYIRFNLTPTQIIRHRLVAIDTTNEHYENTTENSPQAWFEVQVLDAGSGAVIDQQGFGKDYSDETKQDFMVRNKGNFLIEMSGNDVEADIQMLTGTT